MEENIRYLVVEAPSGDQLQEKVQKLLDKGAQLQGGISVSHYVFGNLPLAVFAQVVVSKYPR